MRRGRVVTSAVASGLALGGLAAYAVAGDTLRDRLTGTYTHRLERYDDDAGERNRYLDLPDGEAQLSFGSPDGHRLVVQWRDPDGSGWTAPATVHDEGPARAIDSTIRAAGGTVAIVATYSPADDLDDDSLDHDVLVTCRDLRCTPGRKVTRAAVSEPQLTPDGGTVLYGWSEAGAIAWELGRGYRTWAWDDPFAPRVHATSAPVLAPDGSLRLVQGRPRGGTCRYTLLAAEPRTGSLSAVGRRTAVLPARGQGSECHSYLQTFSADWVGVEPDDHATDGFWFVRRGDRWTATSEDPSGLVRGPDLPRDACCELGIAGFIGWDELAYGSPDGRRITVQAHFQGEETWAPQQVLPGAPPGVDCSWIDGSQVGDDGFAVRLTCHSGPARDDLRGDAYAVAVSRDLRSWETFFVRDAVGEVLVDQDVGVLVAGRPFTSWTLEEGLRVLDLPQPAGSVVGRAEDGTYVRLTLTEGPDGCTGEAVVAEEGDEAWSDPVGGRYVAEPRARCRVDFVNVTEDGGVRFALSSDRATKAALVEPAGDGWRLRRDEQRG